MKDTDKITLTVGQLKRLIKESKQLNEGSIYMDCHTYRDGNYWIIYDEIYHTVVAKISDYDFMHNDKINDFEIIRKWRETHPSRK